MKREGRSSHWTSGPILSMVVLSGLSWIGLATPVHAQALNDVVIQLLGENCAGLRITPIGPPPDPGNGELGPNLTDICRFPTTTGGASAGGGAASSQASALSIQNSVIQQRLGRARAEREGEEPSQSARWLDLRFGNASVLSTTTPDDPAPVRESRRFDLFVSGTVENLDRTVTPFEDGYGSSVDGATIGADYQFSSAVVAGLVATWRRHDGDFDGGGDFEMTSLEPSLYLSILPSDRTFIQVVAGRSSQEFEVNRSVSFRVVRDAGDDGRTELGGTASSGTDASVLGAGAQFGFDHSAGKFTVGPRVGVNYSRTDVDAFAETGGTGLEMRVGEQSVKSLQGVVGFYGSVALSAGSGVFLPQLNVEYVQEFEDSPSVLDAQFVEDLRDAGATTFNYQTNVPDSGFVNVELGVAAVFAHGIQPYLNLRTMVGNTNFDSFAGTIGIRFEF